MSIYLSRSFPRSNSSFFLCSGNALQSEVLRLEEEMFLVDVGLGTPIICMQDEPTGVPINRATRRATRFENKVGFTDVVTGESLSKRWFLERLFIDLVSGKSLLIKERAAARVKNQVGSTDVVAGSRLLLLPRRFRQNRAWMEVSKICRTNKKVKGFFLCRRRNGFSVVIAGVFCFIPLGPFFKKKKKKEPRDQFTILKYCPKFSNFLVL